MATHVPGRKLSGGIRSCIIYSVPTVPTKNKKTKKFCNDEGSVLSNMVVARMKRCAVHGSCDAFWGI